MEPVLKFSEHRERQQQQRYAECLGKVQSIRDSISLTREQLNIFLQGDTEARAYSVHEVRTRHGIVEQLQLQIARLEAELSTSEELAATERRKLIAAHRKTHMMETMKGREMDAHRAHINKQEQVQMDEIASQSLSRRS